MMPSHMVANGGSELRRDSTAATPLDTFLAQQHINASDLRSPTPSLSALGWTSGMAERTPLGCCPFYGTMIYPVSCICALRESVSVPSDSPLVHNTCPLLNIKHYSE